MRILSLDGGGYLGLATASFLAELERHFNQTCHSRFDLFCGTSTGAIIALALASRIPAAKICDLYQSFGPKVFDNRFPGRKAYRLARSMLGSMYDNSALRSTLNETFGDLTLRDLRQKGKQVLVPAFCLTTGRPRVFKTDHSPRLTTDDHYFLRDIALASSAAPVFLPTVDLKSPTTGIRERYCDGGVFANHPALITYAEAPSELGIAPSDIHILSVSTPRSDNAEHLSSAGFLRKVTLRRGLIFWGGPKLISLLIDSTSDIADQALRRLVRIGGPNPAFYERVCFQKPPGLGLDVVNPSATHTLRCIGVEAARQTDMRSRLNLFFQNQGESNG